MNSLSKIEDTFQSAKIKRKEFIVASFDGRTQKFLAEKTGIDEIKLSRWVNGTADLEETEMASLEKVLGVEYK